MSGDDILQYSRSARLALGLVFSLPISLLVISGIYFGLDSKPNTGILGIGDSSELQTVVIDNYSGEGELSAIVYSGSVDQLEAYLKSQLLPEDSNQYQLVDLPARKSVTIDLEQPQQLAFLYKEGPQEYLSFYQPESELVFKPLGSDSDSVLTKTDLDIELELQENPR